MIYSRVRPNDWRDGRFARRGVGHFSISLFDARSNVIARTKIIQRYRLAALQRQCSGGIGGSLGGGCAYTSGSNSGGSSNPSPSRSPSTSPSASQSARRLVQVCHQRAWTSAPLTLYHPLLCLTNDAPCHEM
jgi:hypothetical protein